MKELQKITKDNIIDINNDTIRYIRLIRNQYISYFVFQFIYSAFLTAAMFFVIFKPVNNYLLFQLLYYSSLFFILRGIILFKDLLYINSLYKYAIFLYTGIIRAASPKNGVGNEKE